jgi:YteA family regulatory protein
MAQRRLDTEKFREVLLEERNRLVAKARRIRGRTSVADQTDEVGDLADYDNHPADAASETFEREKDLAIDENMDNLLYRIDRAIEKIDNGTYGVCDRCGREISRERLKVLPFASFCIECQDIVEGR